MRRLRSEHFRWLLQVGGVELAQIPCHALLDLSEAALQPGYPRKSTLPGIQEIAWLLRDPCPQQSASSDPPANHSQDSHETRRFYTVWVKSGKELNEGMFSAFPKRTYDLGVS